LLGAKLSQRSLFPARQSHIFKIFLPLPGKLMLAGLYDLNHNAFYGYRLILKSMKPTVPETGAIVRIEGENAVIMMKGGKSCKGCGK